MANLPKRCFTLTGTDGTKAKFCITWFQLETVYWRFILGPVGGPDPAPGVAPVEIGGVNPTLIREIAILDTISFMSDRLNPEVANGLRAVVARGIQGVKKQLPANVSID